MASPHGFSQTGIELLNAELAKRGIGPAAASGAISGVMGESGGNLDPTSFNSKDPGGGSGGIGQWNRQRLVGPSGMLAFARNAGIPVNVNTPTDAAKVPLAIQAQYLGHELDTTYAGVTKQLRGVTDPQTALNIWVKSYESPADTAGAIKQRSQYLAPVATALGNAPPPGTTINSPPASGAPTTAPGATPATPTAGTTLPGFQPGSPAAKMASTALKQLGGGGGGGEEPSPLRLQQAQPAQAMGGSMMMQPGGQNMQGRMAAQQALAQQGFSMQPQLASYYGALAAAKPPVQAMMPGQATGVPGMPGTTLNSPSQLQMALMSGQMSPYDMYANAGSGGGFGST